MVYLLSFFVAVAFVTVVADALAAIVWFYYLYLISWFEVSMLTPMVITFVVDVVNHPDLLNLFEENMLTYNCIFQSKTYPH